MANIREGAVLWGGKPANLEGPQLAAGQQAPDFLLVGSDMSPLSSKDYAGKVTILAAVPSVDTPVCDLETRTFNQKATEHPGVEVLTVSMDLPFAQKRWCAAAGIERVRTASDHREGSFGRAYGVLQPDRRLFARAVFVVDKQGKIVYAAYMKSVGDQPDYEAVLAAADKAAKA